MPPTAISILVVGADALGTRPIFTGLATRGWGYRSVETLREAQELLRTFRFDIVLAAESLPDGRGYELIDAIARHAGTLFVGVALSESCLWLPVLQRGVNVFGKRALNADVIEYEVETLLRAPGPESVREIGRNDRLGTSRPGLHHALSSRGKGAAAASGEISMTPSAKSAEDGYQMFAAAGKEQRREATALPGLSPAPLPTRTKQPASDMRRPARPE